MAYFSNFFSFLLQYLPKSPFQSFISAIGDIPFLAQLNWFFPVSEIIAVVQAWLVAVGLYYLYSAIMRFIHLIG